jgi:hypothetical protein
MVILKPPGSLTSNARALADGQRSASLTALSHGSGPTIVALNAGDLNLGVFDPFTSADVDRTVAAVAHVIADDPHSL